MTTPHEVPGMRFLNPEGNGIRILSLGVSAQLPFSLPYSPLTYPIDGGDARCFSQLLILEELMHRLEYDHGRSARPCEFFHSITGVGASG
jgi:hypothetical protein